MVNLSNHINEETTPIFITHMKFTTAFLGRFTCMAFLGVEMILPGLTREELATLSDL